MIGHLERLYRTTDAAVRLRHDPVQFPRRYTDPADAEIAAVVAASLAYGRVAAFRPVLEAIFAHVDRSGGPAAFVDAFEPGRDEALRPLIYRWNRGVDFLLLFATLQHTYATVPSLQALLDTRGADDIGPALVGAIDTLRANAVAVAERCGVSASTFSDLPRGFRYFLPSPATGSACKRWNMLLRWMVRPPTEGIDLGLWTDISPSLLVVPLDTHVLRVSRFIGFTTRRDGSWRTALEVTAALRALDSADPIRFDFAMAHLGISGACRGHRDPTICPDCPLDPICQAS